MSAARNQTGELESFERVSALVGDLTGRRALVLGAAAEVVVWAAGAGASVIAVDPDPAHVDAARGALDHEEVRADVRVGDLADLAFLRADSVDVALSVRGLSGLGDLDRLFRQVQRVLRPGAPFAFALPHPASLVVVTEHEPSGALPLSAPAIGRSYFDETPVGGANDAETVHPHTLGSVFVELIRAGWRVDALVEPEPPRTARGRPLVPELVVWRARKEGS